MGDATERRANPRVPMMVRVREAATGEQSQHFSREISLGGLFLETDRPFAKGTTLHLEFQVPGTDHLVKAKAEVVRLGDQGIGVRFLSTDARSKELIAAYVEKLESIRKKLTE